MKFNVKFDNGGRVASKEIEADSVLFETHFVKFCNGQTIDKEIVFSVAHPRVISVEKL